jgi:Protein of unknown function (DUF998)
MDRYGTGGTSQLRGRRAAAVSIAASVYFCIAAITAHILDTQYDAFEDYISDYAIGPWGWVYGSAFWASCIGCVALSIALWRLLPPKARSRLGIALLVIVGVTYAVDFVFPTDILPPGQSPRTTTGLIHFLDAFLGWILFTASALLISSRLEPDQYWKPWRPRLIALAWLSALLLLVLIVVVISKIPFGGLAEKAFILDRNIWSLLLAVLLLKAPTFRRFD